MNFKRKLWWAQHGTDVYKYGTILSLVLIVTISIIYFTYSKFTFTNETTAEPFTKNDHFIASYIDGEWSNEIPGKNDGYIVDKVVCDNGATGTWDNEEWGINIRNATKKIKCGVYFKKLEEITLTFYHELYIGNSYDTYTYPGNMTIEEFCLLNSDKFQIKNGYLQTSEEIEINSNGYGYAIMKIYKKNNTFDTNTYINSKMTFKEINDIILKENNDTYDSYIGYMTCLSLDTEIEVYDEEDKKRKKKKLKDLKVGDKVICVNPYTGELEIDEVTYTDYLENKHHNKYDKWYFSDGTIIETVHRHRFYNIEKHDYTYMDEWIVGEHGYNINGEIIELVKHEEINEDIRHCTLFTKKYNNYFANGMLSGNRHSTKIKFM